MTVPYQLPSHISASVRKSILAGAATMALDACYMEELAALLSDVAQTVSSDAAKGNLQLAACELVALAGKIRNEKTRLVELAKL